MNAWVAQARTSDSLSSCREVPLKARPFHHALNLCTRLSPAPRGLPLDLACCRHFSSKLCLQIRKQPEPKMITSLNVCTSAHHFSLKKWKADTLTIQCTGIIVPFNANTALIEHEDGHNRDHGCTQMLQSVATHSEVCPPVELHVVCFLNLCQ